MPPRLTTSTLSMMRQLSQTIHPTARSARSFSGGGLSVAAKESFGKASAYRFAHPAGISSLTKASSVMSDYVEDNSLSILAYLTRFRHESSKTRGLLLFLANHNIPFSIQQRREIDDGHTWVQARSPDLTVHFPYKEDRTFIGGLEKGLMQASKEKSPETFLLNISLDAIPTSSLILERMRDIQEHTLTGKRGRFCSVRKQCSYAVQEALYGPQLFQGEDKTRSPGKTLLRAPNVLLGETNKELSKIIASGLAKLGLTIGAGTCIRGINEADLDHTQKFEHEYILAVEMAGKDHQNLLINSHL